uniref:Uncharacterized protein n=1 Tax=Ananas comosus var. bracteatus TaxID=296719 RepID=A0A6V7PNL7_ANACO|nr:unnamed protein product [Ananas comosus var. bracteatus]
MDTLFRFLLLLLLQAIPRLQPPESVHYYRCDDYCDYCDYGLGAGAVDVVDGAPALRPAEFSSLPPDLNLDFSSPTTSASGGGGGGGGGGGEVGGAAADGVRAGGAARDSGRVQQLMWMLNELSSAYGDPEQKIAAYFLQGLFARLTSSGPRTLRTLSSAADRAASFESTRRTALRFQELSPWSSFGHVAANGAILEAFLEGARSGCTSST